MVEPLMTSRQDAILTVFPGALQEASHHGRVVREYREQRMGMTQEELAQRIGRSRRTVITIEQSARVQDVKVRRTLALVLQIPPALLGLHDGPVPETVALAPVLAPAMVSKSLSKVVLDAFTNSLRMRFDVYYTGSALRAGYGLQDHMQDLARLLEARNGKDRRVLLMLLSQNYQLQGLIARDQLDDGAAEQCFRRASLLAQEAESVELDALAMVRRAAVYVRRREVETAERLCEAAREITRRSVPALRGYLALVHAEVQGVMRESGCLKSLAEAREMFRRVDPAEDSLLVLHSTRWSERAIEDGWAQCHVALGKLPAALECYDELEPCLDPTMVRMRARVMLRYAWALLLSGDRGSSFYALEGLRLARAVGSRANLRQVQEVVTGLVARFPGEGSVRDVQREMAG